MNSGGSLHTSPPPNTIAQQQQQPSLAYRSDATRYMQHHSIPLLVEALLSQVVPTSHPFPMEAVGQTLIVDAPSAADVERQVDAALGWATCRNEETVTVLGAQPEPGGAALGHAKRRHWIKQLSTLSFNVFALGDEGVNDGPEAIAFIWWIFEACGCLTAMQIDPKVFLRWVVVVRANYHRQNPFHNFRHALNVLQTLFVFLQQATELHAVSTLEAAQGEVGTARSATDDDITTPRLVFTDMEVFAMLVSALCHDVQHVGVNNAFLCDTQHPLAIRHNDAAVLERHHASVTFAILEYAPLPRIRTAPAVLAAGYRPEALVLDTSSHGGTSSSMGTNNFCDIAAALPRRWGPIKGSDAAMKTTLGGCWSDPQQDYTTFRQLVLKCILGTEVAAHKAHLALFKEQVADEVLREVAATQQHPQEGTEGLVGLMPPNDAAMMLLRKNILQQLLAKDATARHTLMVALVEAADVSNEIRSFDFSRQWAPLVVEEFCQQGDAMVALGWTRDIPGMFRRGVAHPSKDQPGFINFLCLPLYRQLASVMPSCFTGCVDALERNATMWSTKW